VNGRLQYVHRLAWAKVNGPIPPGVKIRHTCDNPPCINPAHLLAGSQADNVADMDARGRRQALRGMDATNRKVTEDDVRAIRASAETHAALGRHYGMTPEGIAAIRNRKNWKHVA
jgi:hypothetical protein